MSESIADDADPVIPVILSGGSGTRLWPVSRESFPKQFWPLVSERTMIEVTVRRAMGPGFAPPIVVCNQEHRFAKFGNDAHGVSERRKRLGVNPTAHGTVKCIGTAAHHGAGQPHENRQPGDRHRQFAEPLWLWLLHLYLPYNLVRTRDHDGTASTK